MVLMLTQLMNITTQQFSGHVGSLLYKQYDFLSMLVQMSMFNMITQETPLFT